MPIHCPITIRAITDAAFASIDSLVMKCAFASHSSMGRLSDERVYENDLTARLRAEGLSDVHTQVPLTVSQGDFAKTYRLDLVVNGIVYELKTVAALAPAHDVQAIHYAALLNVDRIKLLNFRAPKLVGKLLRCPFPHTNRFEVTIDNSRWHPASTQCEQLAARASSLFRCWGGFLDSHLYEEALIHLNGGEAHCVQRIPVARDGLLLGTHPVQLHAPDSAFVVTTLHADQGLFERQLRRLMNFLPLKTWQWINLNHSVMELITIQKEDQGMKSRSQCP